MKIRPPAVAGTFYPGEPTALRTRVLELMTAARPGQTGPLKALVAPHAGYVYSGPIAASAYAALEQSSAPVSRVVLLGPAHRVAFRGLALPSATHFETPLGLVSLDLGAGAALADLPQVRTFDRAHAEEHGLEVHLPFLQEVVGELLLVPLVVGEATAQEVAEVLARLWGGEETLIVVSTDLSHYLDDETARRRDQATAEIILQLGWDRLGEGDACGRFPLAGLLFEAARRGLQARLLDLRNSADTAGPRNQVVGYGAFAIG
ncbi:MAG TPA: AmmeMemoRadiSam system protein B [Thermoanaerobaculia bacterium]|nr:AmmeMemoRadiSam system protein B [Thermoanaerobaculia bacterium]